MAVLWKALPGHRRPPCGERRGRASGRHAGRRGKAAFKDSTTHDRGEEAMTEGGVPKKIEGKNCGDCLFSKKPWCVKKMVKNISSLGAKRGHPHQEKATRGVVTWGVRPEKGAWAEYVRGSSSQAAGASEGYRGRKPSGGPYAGPCGRGGGGAYHRPPYETDHGP